VTGTPTAPGSPSRSLAGRLRAFWAAPDEFLLDAGAAAELFIAKFRLGFTLLILLGPLGLLTGAAGSRRDQYFATFLIALVAVLTALLVLLLVQRERRQRWLPMATSVVDVTLITFALAAHALTHEVGDLVENRAGFDLYFVALAATCLRYDARVALVAGALATVEYLGLAAALATTARGVARGFGDWWMAHGPRAGLLLIATGVNVVIVRGLERQHRLSSSDPLTGLFNRRFFDDYLAKEVARANRYHTRFAVAMVDVDRFKSFNDTFGHPAGDRALRTLARVLQHAVRRSDIVARYGGEEIVVIFRDTDADAAVERVEEIRRAVAAEGFTVGRLAVPARITVSAGVASWPEDGLTADDVVALADRRLFEAKRAGRNRVVGPPAEDRPARMVLLKGDGG
jgi:diguanylate cyclase (GGDEF)-like protein